MKNRNLLATFELSQGDEKTMETIAEAITHADHCFVKIVEHWRDDTASWNTYAIVQPSLAFLSDKGELVLDVDHIVEYEFSGDRMYTTGVDCCNTVSVGRSTDATVYIYRRVPRLYRGQARSSGLSSTRSKQRFWVWSCSPCVS